MLGKDEKHSRISENFLDIWAGQSLSKRNQEKSSNSQLYFKRREIKTSSYLMLECMSFQTTHGEGHGVWDSAIIILYE